MRFKVVMLPVIIVMFSLLFTAATFAEQKYIVKLKDTAIVPLSIEEDADFKTLVPKMNLYTADEETAESLQQAGLTEYIEENVPLEAYSYNDMYFSSQNYYSNLDIEEIHKKYGKGKGVRVAVIDSGVLTSHSDLTNADIETGYNYLDDNTDVTDTMGHGTRVMGLLCATANNGIGIAGIAPEATYVPLLVMRTNEGTAADLIQAIYDAVDKYNCKILNVSAGFETNLRVVKEAVDYVANKGAIMVCSAGNDGNNSPCYPASYDNTISVGAVDSNMELTSYSQRNSKVDVVAEGNFSYLLSYTGGYTSGKGTSFSSPIICGTAALIAQKYPDITLTDFRNIIKACTLDILDSGKDYAGYGYLKPLYAFEFMEDPNDVFVSPVYEKDSSTLNVKMYSKKGTASFKAIASVFENGSFSSFNIADAKANTYGIYTETLDNTIGTNKELRIFALENLNNLKNISDIRSVKQ